MASTLHRLGMDVIEAELFAPVKGRREFRATFTCVVCEGVQDPQLTSKGCQRDRRDARRRRACPHDTQRTTALFGSRTVRWAASVRPHR